MGTSSSFNLYEALGLTPDADPTAIKRAHRAKSRAHHPDTGDGDRAKFDRVQLAARVLGDPTRRAEYDLSGEIDDEADNAVPRMLKIIGVAIAAVFDKGEDIASFDLISGLRSWFAKSRQQADAQRGLIADAAEDAESALSRLTFNGSGPDLLTALFQQKIREARAALASIDAQLVDFEAARTLVDQYQYRFDPAAKPFHGSTGTGWGNSPAYEQIVEEMMRDMFKSSFRPGDRG